MADSQSERKLRELISIQEEPIPISEEEEESSLLPIIPVELFKMYRVLFDSINRIVNDPKVIETSPNITSAQAWMNAISKEVDRVIEESEKKRKERIAKRKERIAKRKPVVLGDQITPFAASSDVPSDSPSDLFAEIPDRPMHHLNRAIRGPKPKDLNTVFMSWKESADASLTQPELDHYLSDYLRLASGSHVGVHKIRISDLAGDIDVYVCAKDHPISEDLKKVITLSVMSEKMLFIYFAMLAPLADFSLIIHKGATERTPEIEATWEKLHYAQRCPMY